MADVSKTRNWVCIAYPENISQEDLDLFLENLHCECVRSPLHHGYHLDSQEERKDHWHILLLFEGPKSFNQIERLLKPINPATPQQCQSVRGSVRYFVHADNPEKEQFHYADLKSFSGVNVFDLFCPTSAEKDGIMSAMQKYVRDNNILEFSDLFDYAESNYFDTWYWCLTHGSGYLMQMYIGSRRNKQKMSVEAKLQAMKDAKAEIVGSITSLFRGYYLLDPHGECYSVDKILDSLV